MQGFFFTLNNVKWSGSCDEINRWQLKLIMLLSQHNIEGKIAKDIKACSYLMDKSFKAMLSYKFKSIETKEDLVKHLKIYNYEQKEIDKITSYFQVKNKIKKENKELINLFFKMASLVDDSKQKSKFYKLSKEVLEKLPQKKKTLLVYLIESLVAMSNNNIAWLKKNIKEILRRDIGHVVFDFQKYYFSSEKEYNDFFTTLLKVFEMIGNKIDDRLLFKLFLYYLDYGLEDKKISDLREKLVDNWSLVEIRETLQSNNYGKQYLQVWSLILKKRSSDQEVNNFLESSLSPIAIKKGGPNFFSIYFDFLPKKKEALRAVVGEVRRSSVSIDEYDRYLFLKLIKNDVIKSFLAPFLPELRFANFQLERNYFREMLKKGSAIEFSIFNLIRLGDMDDELLWWMIL